MTTSAGWKVQELKLGAFHWVDKAEPGNYQQQITKDGCHFAYVLQQGGEIVVGLDGKSTKRPGKTNNYGLVLSPDGSRVAYTESKDGKDIVFVDGKRGQQYDFVHALAFSPDSRRLAYAAHDGKKSFVVVDGKPGPQFASVEGESITFSDDGKRLGYIAVEAEKRFVVVDGLQGPKFDNVRYLRFSPDGKHVAYAAEENSGTPEWKSFIVLDGQIGTKHQGGNTNSPLFSPDSKRLAYATGEKQTGFVVVDGQAGPEYQTPPSLIVFSPDSKRLAYVANNYKPKMKCFLVLDGQAYAEYDLIGNPIFSPDSKRLAFTANEKGEGNYGKNFVVVDGKPGQKFNQGPRQLTFSPDSKRVAYVTIVEDGGQFTVFVDGQRVGKDFYETYNPTFSPNSRHVACRAFDEAGEFFILIDGLPGPKHDLIIENGPRFRADGSLEYLAVKDSILYRVILTPPD